MKLYSTSENFPTVQSSRERHTCDGNGRKGDKQEFAAACSVLICKGTAYAYHLETTFVHSTPRYRVISRHCYACAIRFLAPIHPMPEPGATKLSPRESAEDGGQRC